MAIEYSVVIAYIVGILLLYVVGRVFLTPVKIIWKLVYNALIGGVVLLVINFFGSIFNFYMPLNIITALVCGFLGLPGIILIVILKGLFN